MGCVANTEVDETSPEFRGAARVILERYGEPGAELGRCPDQYVGNISALATGESFRNRIPAVSRPTKSCVLLVLESPHTEEFVAQVSTPNLCGQAGPAKGATGRKIVEHLLRVDGLSDCSSFGLILVNAVQYQCSRGVDTQIHRDRVFREIWRAGGRQDFIKRLADIYRAGDIVVNACTRGRYYPRPEQLRSLVQGALLEFLPESVEPLRRNHPTNWHLEPRRSFEWTAYI